MSMHRGRYIKNLIKENEFSISEVAKRISVSRNTIYRWINSEKLQFVKMMKVADAINVDISIDFPEMERIKTDQKKKLLAEDRTDESITIKTKYMRLLEKHTSLLEEYSQLKEEMAKYRTNSKN